MRHARSLACFCFLPLILLVLAAPARADFTPTSAFTDHGDGTVTHTVTGLMWQRCSMGQAWNGSGCSGEAGEYTFEQAQGLTSSLGGHADWRLPSLWELMTIVDYDESNPAINGEVFPDTLSSLFWSGSPFANLSDVAWYVHFRHGNANGSSRDDARSVRLVRGAQSFDPFAQPTSDYRDNGDGTVTHLRTGLMWQRCAVGQNWSGGALQRYGNGPHLRRGRGTHQHPRWPRRLAVAGCGGVGLYHRLLRLQSCDQWRCLSQYAVFGFLVGFSRRQPFGLRMGRLLQLRERLQRLPGRCKECAVGARRTVF